MKYALVLLAGLFLVGCEASGEKKPACPEGEAENRWGLCIPVPIVDFNKDRKI